MVKVNRFTLKIVSRVWWVGLFFLLTYVITTLSNVSPNESIVSICPWFQCKKIAFILSMDEIHASYGPGTNNLSNDWGFYWLEPDGFYATHVAPLLANYPFIQLTMGWVPGGYTTASCAWKNEPLNLMSYSWTSSIGQEWATKVLKKIYATGQVDPYSAHGYSHENYNLLSTAQVKERLNKIQLAFFNVTGHPASGFNTFPFFEERLDMVPLFVDSGFYHLGVRGKENQIDFIKYHYLNGSRVILLPYNWYVSENNSIGSLAQIVTEGMDTNKRFGVVRIFMHARSKVSCGSGKVLSDSLETNYVLVEKLLNSVKKYEQNLWFTTDHTAAHYFDVVNNVRIFDLQQKTGAFSFKVGVVRQLFNWTDSIPLTLVFNINEREPVAVSCVSNASSYFFTTHNFTRRDHQVMVDIDFPNRDIICTVLLTN